MCLCRYLELYDKVHFFGEDPDQRRVDAQDELPGQRKKVNQVSTVPLRYNHYQHKLSGLCSAALMYSRDEAIWLVHTS